jgi:hypothetical protein
MEVRIRLCVICSKLVCVLVLWEIKYERVLLLFGPESNICCFTEARVIAPNFEFITRLPCFIPFVLKLLSPCLLIEGNGISSRGLARAESERSVFWLRVANPRVVGI